MILPVTAAEVAARLRAADLDVRRAGGVALLVVGTHPPPMITTKGIHMNNIALTAFDLRGIADALDKLAKSGVRVDSALVGGHRIRVQWHDDQRDGSWSRSPRSNLRRRGVDYATCRPVADKCGRTMVTVRYRSPGSPAGHRP